MLEVQIYITGECNLHCPFCSGRLGKMAGSRDLPLDRWRDFFHELGENRVFRVTLTGGGEPFIRKDLVEICRSIAENRMRWRIRTNGTLITESTAAELAEVGRCDEIRVSLDGLEADHDAVRGEGVFQRATKGIGFLQKAGLPVSVHTTIAGVHLGTLRLFLDFLDSIGVSRVSEGLVKPTNGKTDYFREMDLLNGADIARSLTEHRDLPERLRRLIVRSAPLKLWRQWRKWLLEPESFPPVSRKGRTVSCSVIRRSVAVSPDGKISPCSYRADRVGGRIGEDSVMAVWRELNAQLERIDCIPDPECAECEHLPLCGYHCQGRPPYCFKASLPFLSDLKTWPRPEELFPCWDGR